MGVGLDQSPHYFSISSKYREANPETNIGQAGDLTQVVFQSAKLLEEL